MTEIPAAPRKRGRPPKPKVEKPKGKPGRPRKVVPPADIEGEKLAAIDLLVSMPLKRTDKVVLDDANIQIVGRLAAIFCTQEEIASVLGISANTLGAIFKRQPEVREIYEDGQKRARISLRRKQFDLAGKNHPMSIFLGKNYLGQKDVHTTDMTVTKQVSELTMEQLLEIAAQAEGPVPNKQVH